MRNLLIHSRHNKYAPASLPFPTVEALLERLKPAGDLTDQALARLVLRLRAHYPVSLPLRADADVTTLVSWLTEAGAIAELSTAPTAVASPSAPSLPVLASIGASAAVKAEG